MNIRYLFALMMVALTASYCGAVIREEDPRKKKTFAAEAPQPSVVYFIDSISPENLVRIYEALGREAKGKVCVKLSTGEAGNPNHLDPDLIAPLVQGMHADIVECNTAYKGKRFDSEEHRRVAAEHGFTRVAPVVIMDEFGEIALPVEGGRHLKENYVGKDWEDYDFTVILSHFKGHPMGGFGGALKNVAIGMASAQGKSWIHTAGKTKDLSQIWKVGAAQDDFLESMGDACKSVMDRAGENILYISVANNMSVDCDCVGSPAPVEMGDIGILASLDPVALDRACVDMVMHSSDPGKVHLVERIESRHGTHLLDYAEELGLGSQNYILKQLPASPAPAE